MKIRNKKLYYILDPKIKLLYFLNFNRERNSTKYKMHQVKKFGMIAGGTGITPIYQVS